MNNEIFPVIFISLVAFGWGIAIVFGNPATSQKKLLIPILIALALATLAAVLPSPDYKHLITILHFVAWGTLAAASFCVYKTHKSLSALLWVVFNVLCVIFIVLTSIVLPVVLLFRQ